MHWWTDLHAHIHCNNTQTSTDSKQSHITQRKAMASVSIHNNGFPILLSLGQFNHAQLSVVLKLNERVQKKTKKKNMMSLSNPQKCEWRKQRWLGQTTGSFVKVLSQTNAIILDSFRILDSYLVATVPFTWVLSLHSYLKGLSRVRSIFKITNMQAHFLVI